MGNQQEIAYIAGLFEGEGSINITRQPVKVGNVQYRQQVNISNTDKGVIDKTINFLKFHKLDHHVAIHYKKGSKPCYQISLTTYKSRLKFLKMIIKHLAGIRKERAQIMIEHINYRTNQKIRWKRRGAQENMGDIPNTKPKWTEKDRVFYERYRETRKASSSETKRDAPIE